MYVFLFIDFSAIRLLLKLIYAIILIFWDICYIYILIYVFYVLFLYYVMDTRLSKPTISSKVYKNMAVFIFFGLSRNFDIEIQADRLLKFKLTKVWYLGIQFS